MKRRLGVSAAVLAFLATMWWNAREDPVSTTLTLQLELDAIKQSATRWSPRPFPTTQLGLVGLYKKQAVDDPPGSPDDAVTKLEADFDVVTEWLGDTYTLVPDTNRAGAIELLRGYVRLWSSSSVTKVRGLVELDGQEARGGILTITTSLTWVTMVVDLPHPAGKAWTYEELDRVAVGYEVEVQAGATLDQLTQFYPELEATTADGAVDMVTVRRSALHHSLD